MSVEITVNNVSKAFGRQVALDDISVRFDAGKLHGLIGGEGAGKTTLLRIIMGLLRPDKGKITYICDGKETELKSIRERISYMPGRQSLYPDLSVAEHMEFFRAMYRVPRAVFKEKSEELLHITRLEKFAYRKASELSGGMYKKLGLICALLQSPDVLMLDEPTNGVDPISRREFWELLYRLHDQKILIVISTAYMDEAERCTNVHLLDEGASIATGEPLKLLKEESVKTFNEYFIKVYSQRRS